MKSLGLLRKGSSALLAAGLILAFFGASGTAASILSMPGLMAPDGYGSVASEQRKPIASTEPARVQVLPNRTEQTDDLFTQMLTRLPARIPQGRTPDPESSKPGLQPNEKSQPGYPPDRISIPTIQLDAPVVKSGAVEVTVQGQRVEEWTAPEKYAVGWQDHSALLGVVGNTVLNGHIGIYGDVFGKLADLGEGDSIFVYSNEIRFTYTVTNRMILSEGGQDLETRMANAAWIEPSQDERLTLVTCWPANSNSHRLILVAQRVAGPDPLKINP